jgi:thymidylate synthase (FAD)
MTTKEIKVLDKGFVKILNISGPVRRESNPNMFLKENPYESSLYKPFDADSIDIAKAARICFDNFEEARSREQDLKLVDYLLRNKHTSPVEMIETWWEMKLPIFLARQFVRHRTATINEVSGRYSTLPEDWYIPETVGGKSTSNKQGQEDSLTKPIQWLFKQLLNLNCWVSYKLYKLALFFRIAPEHARLLLHLNHYTHWIWKQDLHNLFHFLSLRSHEHAQVEARIYANAMYDILKVYLPEVMEMFDKYRRL